MCEMVEWLAVRVAQVYILAAPTKARCTQTAACGVRGSWSAGVPVLGRVESKHDSSSASVPVCTATIGN